MSEVKYIQITTIFTGDVIYAGDAEDLSALLVAAAKSGADMSRANLYGANLYGANLYGANLSGANLSRANLSRANLSGANLYGANLYGANLYGANLYGANLYGANLSGANLYGANLSGADLSRADLSRANLSGANLSGANLYGASIDGEKLTKAPLGVSGLRWWILVTDGYMRIGCQRHTHSEWADMSDKQISDMDSAAAEFWLLWKAPLLSMCAAHAVGLSSDPSKEK